MRLRTSYILIRTVLILISFQFFAPAFLAQEGEAQNVTFEQVLHKHSQAPGFGSLFEKTEKESEEEERDKIEAVEILDLFICYTERISASQTTTQFQTVSQHIQELPLFDFLCTYRI